MALRFPFRTKSSSSTTGTGTLTLLETPAVGWRTFTRAVTDGDLASSDEVIFLIVDTTVTNGPLLLELSRGVYDNTAKTLTRATVYQPNGVAQSFGAGTRDVIVVDNPLLQLLLVGGTMSGRLSVLLSGSIITPFGDTGLLVQASSVAGTTAAISCVSGASGTANLRLGDTAVENQGGLKYDNATDTLHLRTSGSDRSKVTSAGVLQTSASVPYDALPTGTKVVFYQAAAPTGWTQDAAVNDRVLRVVSTAGGGTGGSWTISGITVDGHALSEAEMPAHVHSVAYGFIQVETGAGQAVDGLGSGAQSANTGSVGSGSSHTHALTIGSAWRPAYADVLVAAKN